MSRSSYTSHNSTDSWLLNIPVEYIFFVCYLETHVMRHRVIVRRMRVPRVEASTISCMVSFFNKVVYFHLAYFSQDVVIIEVG